MLILAALQNPHAPRPTHSAPMMVRVRVVQTCVLSASGSVCGGSRDAPPRVTREAGRIVYSF